MTELRPPSLAIVVSFILVAAMYDPRATCCWVRQEKNEPKCIQTSLSKQQSVNIASLRKAFKYQKRKLDLYASCGISEVDLLDHIIGGEPSPLQAWPWQAHLYGLSDTALCGAVLIAPQWIVTAGHCYTKKQAYRILLGANSISGYRYNKKIQARQSQKLIRHPEYNADLSHENDIMLIKMNKPVNYTDYVFPACLPQKNMNFTNTLCYISGYGRVSPTGAEGSGLLKQIRASVITNQRCKTAWESGQVRVDHRNICLRNWEDPANGPCLGDSGGPLSCKVGKYFYVAGVASMVADLVKPDRIHCTGTIPDIYTRVSSYFNWIVDTMDKNTKLSL